MSNIKNCPLLLSILLISLISGCSSIGTGSRQPPPVWVCASFNGIKISADIAEEPIKIEHPNPSKLSYVAVEFHLCGPGEREAI